MRTIFINSGNNDGNGDSNDGDGRPKDGSVRVNESAADEDVADAGRSEAATLEGESSTDRATREADAENVDEAAVNRKSSRTAESTRRAKASSSSVSLPLSRDLSMHRLQQSLLNSYARLAATIMNDESKSKEEREADVNTLGAHVLAQFQEYNQFQRQEQLLAKVRAMTRKEKKKNKTSKKKSTDEQDVEPHTAGKDMKDGESAQRGENNAESDASASTDINAIHKRNQAIARMIGSNNAKLSNKSGAAFAIPPRAALSEGIFDGDDDLEEYDEDDDEHELDEDTILDYLDAEEEAEMMHNHHHHHPQHSPAIRHSNVMSTPRRDGSVRVRGNSSNSAPPDLRQMSSPFAKLGLTVMEISREIERQKMLRQTERRAIQVERRPKKKKKTDVTTSTKTGNSNSDSLKTGDIESVQSETHKEQEDVNKRDADRDNEVIPPAEIVSQESFAQTNASHIAPITEPAQTAETAGSSSSSKPPSQSDAAPVSSSSSSSLESTPQPSTSSSSPSSDPSSSNSSSSSSSMSESAIHDWGQDEFRPIVFTNVHSAPPFQVSKSQSRSAAVGRPSQLLFVGLNERQVQLPSQPYHLALPQALMRQMWIEAAAREVTMKTGGRPLKTFIGIFFRKDTENNKQTTNKQEKEQNEKQPTAKDGKDENAAAAETSTTTKDTDNAASTEVKQIGTSANKDDAQLPTEDTTTEPTTATKTTNQTPASAAPPSSSSSSSSSSPSSALVHRPAPTLPPVDLSAFEPVGLLAEVVSVPLEPDAQKVIVLCHRRISLLDPSAAGAVNDQGLLRVRVRHHDEPTWTQLDPPILRYDKQLLELKDKCLRILREIRSIEGEKTFQARQKSWFTFNKDSPGNIIDFWSSLASVTHYPTNTASRSDAALVKLNRGVLTNLDLIPRAECVSKLLEYELKLVQRQKSILDTTSKILQEKHHQLLQAERKRVEEELKKMEAESRKLASRIREGGRIGEDKDKDKSDKDKKDADEKEKEAAQPKSDKERQLALYTSRLEKKVLPVDVQPVIEDELDKFRAMESESSFEYASTRSYLDWLTSMPWGQYTTDRFDIKYAERVMDEQHHGMEDVKQRILEFVATGKLMKGMPQGKILCLVGPPGVGKTSIGRSIAAALQRKFYRFSVGGLEDVSEIKGHRRTYIGAMPGKIIQALKRSESSNPVILIDELDKLGRSHRGDPSSALLEVLDPEQNAAFSDHYLDVPVDLSKVLFIATANERSNIPEPLQDRMDFISLSGYVAAEKVSIARDYLEPTVRTRTGVSDSDVHLNDDALFHLIRWYCREAGVRSLQKYIERIYRKVALQIAKKKKALNAKAQEEKVNPTTASATSSVAATSTSHATTSAPDATTPDTATSNTTPTSATPSAESSSTSLPPSERLIITPDNLKEYAGPPKYLTDKLYEVNPVGVSTGLAYSSHGGAVLFIESAAADAAVVDEDENQSSQIEVEEEEDEHDEEEEDEGEDGDKRTPRIAPHAHPSGSGRGDLFCTGQLGAVMRESSSIAYTVAKRILWEVTHPDSRHRHFFAKHRVHLHLPSGATPKDGPSAGIAMVTSLLSLALNTPPAHALAMTGELTLTGKVLPIGGVKEKIMAAKHARISMGILPDENRKDVDELKSYVTDGLSIHYVRHYDEVFKLIFPHFADQLNDGSVLEPINKDAVSPQSPNESETTPMDDESPSQQSPKKQPAAAQV